MRQAALGAAAVNATVNAFAAATPGAPTAALCATPNTAAPTAPVGGSLPGPIAATDADTADAANTGR